MSAYVNCGASDTRGNRIKTKKALREALKGDAASVLFDSTSMFQTGPATYTGETLPHNIILSVVGPHPYESRKWYASISKAPDGSLRVS